MSNLCGATQPAKLFEYLDLEVFNMEEDSYLNLLTLLFLARVSVDSVETSLRLRKLNQQNASSEIRFDNVNEQALKLAATSSISLEASSLDKGKFFICDNETTMKKKVSSMNKNRYLFDQKKCKNSFKYHTKRDKPNRWNP